MPAKDVMPLYNICTLRLSDTGVHWSFFLAMAAVAVAGMLELLDGTIHKGVGSLAELSGPIRDLPPGGLNHHTTPRSHHLTITPTS